jgi:hypothetical protein
MTPPSIEAGWVIVFWLPEVRKHLAGEHLHLPEDSLDVRRQEAEVEVPYPRLYPFSNASDAFLGRSGDTKGLGKVLR